MRLRSQRPGARTCIYRDLGTAMASLPEPVVAALAAVVGDVWPGGTAPPAGWPERHLAAVLARGRPASPTPRSCWTGWARRSFRSYARYWMEGARLPRRRPARSIQRMHVETAYDHLVPGMAAGQGVVMALPHVGSWEWGGAWLAHIGYPMTAVAERIEPPELFEWFVDERRAMGLRIVPLDDAALGHGAQAAAHGGLVGLLCDRDLVGNGVEVDFFGERTTMPGGPATLALRAGAALIAGAVYSGPGPSAHGGHLCPPRHRGAPTRCATT